MSTQCSGMQASVLEQLFSLFVLQCTYEVQLGAYYAFTRTEMCAKGHQMYIR